MTPMTATGENTIEGGFTTAVRPLRRCAPLLLAVCGAATSAQAAAQNTASDRVTGAIRRR